MFIQDKFLISHFLTLDPTQPDPTREWTRPVSNSATNTTNISMAVTILPYNWRHPMAMAINALYAPELPISVGRGIMKCWAMSLCPSVCRVPRPNWRIKKPKKFKIGRMEASNPNYPPTYLEVKRLKVKVTGSQTVKTLLHLLACTRICGGSGLWNSHARRSAARIHSITIASTANWSVSARSMILNYRYSLDCRCTAYWQDTSQLVTPLVMH